MWMDGKGAFVAYTNLSSRRCAQCTSIALIISHNGHTKNFRSYEQCWVYLRASCNLSSCAYGRAGPIYHPSSCLNLYSPLFLGAAQAKPCLQCFPRPSLAVPVDPA